MIDFPPLEAATPEGLLALGGDLSVPSLLLAYRRGIFPWPLSPQAPLAWFSPDPRGVLTTHELHISRSLGKVLRQKKYHITTNQRFPEVIEQCRHSVRKNQSDTWITGPMVQAYIDLHRHGHAYSVEATREGKLVGGLYGVTIGRYFSGESMFTTQTDASKVALVTLVEALHSQGVPFLDTQMVTPVTRALGAREIPRSQFVQQLQHLLSAPPLDLATVNLFQDQGS